MNKKPVVYVATNREMNNSVYETRLWMATRNSDLSRRKLLDEIANTIYDYCGMILMEGGRIWPVPNIYDVFGDTDGRWLSYYCKAVDGRPRHKPRPQTLERRRIIDLYFRIKHRDIAAHFKR